MLRQEAKDGGATGGRGRSAGRPPGRAGGEGAALAPRRTRRGVPEVHLACTGCYPNRDLELDPDHKRDSPVAAFPFLLPMSAGAARHARGARRKHSAVGAAACCRGQLRIAPPCPPSPLHHHHHGTRSDASGKGPDSPRSREAASCRGTTATTPLPPRPHQAHRVPDHECCHLCDVSQDRPLVEVARLLGDR
ncbi:uncharacterized protein LOC144945729 isoform X3 [Lampetra fluviatilis]